MKSTCLMELEFPDEKTARNIAKALELDNAGFIETRVTGRTLFVTASADNVMSLRNTLDDYLACVTVAQKSLEGTD
jgi:tRNA threonylcarbamoyladenosine modification (KEOPS) complex  Pcc1 subunit